MILSIATSSLQGSIALIVHSSDRWCVASERTWTKSEGHSERATLALEELMLDYNMDWTKIRSLSVCVGPGSFTGVRVGINLARSLAFSLDLKCSAISSLRLACEPMLDQGRPVAVAINAQRNEIFAAIYEAEGSGSVEERLPPTCMTPEKFERIRPANAIFLNEPDVSAGNVAGLLNRAPDQGPTLRWHELIPLYLRASAAEEKLRSGELRPFRKR